MRKRVNHAKLERIAENHLQRNEGQLTIEMSCPVGVTRALFANYLQYKKAASLRVVHDCHPLATLERSRSVSTEPVVQTTCRVLLIRVIKYFIATG